MTEEFPEVGLEFELRFTRRALDDLGVSGLVARGDAQAIEQAALKRDLVAKFVEQRSAVPTGTDAPMRNVGRPDIFSLHGRDGVRACTWFDEANRECWFLGSVDEHDYTEFETRAVNKELLPDAEDLVVLYQERHDFEQAVSAGLTQLVQAALSDPGRPVRGTVGGLLRLEISVIALSADDGILADLYLIVQTPPLAEGVDQPGGWPGTHLLERLAELATGESLDTLTLSVPTEVPAIDGNRPVNLAKEMAIVVECHFFAADA